ncbi:MAG: hypothetical protein RQ866_05810 [Bacteroidales bacterium]|nr:hypothetical protein [Bacteroidales bacterium]
MPTFPFNAQYHTIPTTDFGSFVKSDFFKIYEFLNFPYIAALFLSMLLNTVVVIEYSVVEYLRKNTAKMLKYTR